MKRVVTGALIFIVTAAALALGYFVGNGWLSVIWSIVTVICITETKFALGERLPKSLTVLAVCYAIAICVPQVLEAFGFTSEISADIKEYIIILCFVIIASAICIIDSCKHESVIYIGFLAVYPTLPMLSLLKLNTVSISGAPYINITAIILAFTVASLTDVFAWMIGSRYGKNKLCPEISPNKTIEGAVGGLVGGIIGAFAVYIVCEVFGMLGLGTGFDRAWIIYVVAGVCGSAFTQVGDLVASMVKRMAGIKDFSHLLGSHGGFMDRFDGAMMSMSLTYLLMILAING